MFIIGFGLSFYRIANVLQCTTFNNNCTVFNPATVSDITIKEGLSTK